ncbi:hypothetical protein HRI_004137300 [Hibiscus trionum]|uniref:rRNA N-glycosylase n=1 Tax=Hibiscus trionum TaxID=183268 RepID=A0A9W7IZ67_HIBTR|nr:hypothetical protein HRI_004137300 [Hibiscus trionum]
MEGPKSAGSLSTVKPLTAVYKVTFGAGQATQSTYIVFIKNLINALVVHGSASHGLPVLPSDQDLQLTDPKRYVVVEVSNKSRNVSFAIDATTVYILGYRPGVGTSSYFFNDVSPVVQNLFFQGTTRTDLKFDGGYGTLEKKAGVDSRDQIPLGFVELRQQIDNLNDYTHLPGDNKQIAHALLVGVQMISEAARLKVIQQQLAALAPVLAGGSDKTLADPKELDVLIEFQNGWNQLSKAIQTANPNGTFRTSVTINHVTYTNVDSARPLIAILKKYLPGTNVLDQVVDAGVGSE